MTSTNFNSKIPQEMQKRLAQVDKHDAFHSHAYAKEDPNGKRLGSVAAPTSFEGRVRQEFNRQHVGQYRHSRIGVPTEHIREHVQTHGKPDDKQQVQKEMGGIKARFQAGPGVTGRPNPSFQEPRGRSYNPYA